MTRKKKIILLIILIVPPLITLLIIGDRKWADIYRGIEFSAAYTDRNGELLEVFQTEEDKYRMFRPLSEYPPRFVEAVLMQEDRHYYSHNGVDLGAVVRAFWQTYIVRSRRIGASTITMQTAKLKYGIYTKSPAGKIKQIFLAWRLEFLYTKEQILECYLNLVPCGYNIEGFETASWYYFNKSVQDLSLSECFTLVVLPQNPIKRSPNRKKNPKELLDARKILYDSWCQSHPEDIKDSVYFDMDIYTVCDFPDHARHYTEMLNGSEFDYCRKRTGTVRTTIDLGIQRKIVRAVNSYVDQNRSLGVSNSAVLLIDKEKMEVVASVGSADYYDDSIEGQVNGTTAKRSPGSTLKPFIYALACEQGLIHYSTMLRDAPQSFSEYVPDNYESVFKGPLPAWFALCDSRNIPAVDLGHRTNKNGYGIYEFMQDCGVTGLKDEDHYGLSIVLGTADVTMMELGKMYCALGNGGVFRDLYYTRGDHPYNRGYNVLTKESAFVVRKMLEENSPPYDLGQSMENIPVAWKTGTSIGFKDSWAVGIFDRYVLVVWIGNFSGLGNNSFIGRKMSGPLFFNIASLIMSNTPKEQRLWYPDPPPRVSKVEVCAVSGGIPNDSCPTKEETWFIPGVSPITRCQIHRKINVDTRTGYRTDESVGKYVTEVVREFWPSDMQDLFKKAGLPRLEPPPYPPEDYTFDQSSRGFPPKINSPLDSTEYVFRINTPERNTIFLNAGADADTNELLWFAGSDFIGRCNPGEALEWKPDAGDYEVTVSDARGRSSSVKISVVYR